MKQGKFLLVATLLFLINYGRCNGDNKSKDSVLSAFINIDNSPSIITYFNNKEINNNGGHLQGVQLLERKLAKYAVLTGSSSTYSYYSVVKLGDKNEVLSVNKLMDKPYKHAGGFQIFQNFMAVGIEDNSELDKSIVCIFDLSDPEKPTINPIAVIKRAGEPMRSTAGCVGITKYEDKALVAVGDWDTKHIDLYGCKFGELAKNCLDKIHSIDIETISKADWIDTNWYSYQNINLFTSNGNEIYLVGLGQNNKDENIADLYCLKEKNSGEFKLTKIASKTFDCLKDVNFRAGVGVFLDDNGEFHIISCGNKIERTSYLNYFERSNK